MEKLLLSKELKGGGKGSYLRKPQKFNCSRSDHEEAEGMSTALDLIISNGYSKEKLVIDDPLCIIYPINNATLSLI